MNKFWLSCCFVGSAVISTAQYGTDWTLENTGPTIGDTYNSIELLPDGDFIAVGTVCDATFAPMDGLVVRYRPNGTVVWRVTYDNGGRKEIFNDVAIAPSGRILVTGSATPASGGTPQMLTATFQTTGALYWARLYSGGTARPGGKGGSEILSDSAGNPIVLGVSSPTTGKVPIIVRYSVGGNVTRETLYTNPVSMVRNFHARPDGGLSFITHHSTTIQQSEVVSTDASDAVLRSLPFSPFGHTSFVFETTPTPSGDFYAVGVTDPGGAPQWRYSRYAPNGELLWTKTKSTGFVTSVDTFGGGLFMVGRIGARPNLTRVNAKYGFMEWEHTGPTYTFYERLQIDTHGKIYVIGADDRVGRGGSGYVNVFRFTGLHSFEQTLPIHYRYLSLGLPTTGQFRLMADSSYGFRLQQYGQGPEPVAEAYTFLRNTSSTVSSPGVLGNDRYSTGLTCTLSQAPRNGALTLNPNGSFTYVPNTGFVGYDAFTYSMLRDGRIGYGDVKIKVVPPATPALLELSTSRVRGGNTLVGRVTLSSNAPFGGTTVTLSDNSTAITLPKNLVIPAGTKVGTFTITTSAVTSNLVNQRIYAAVGTSFSEPGYLEVSSNDLVSVTLSRASTTLPASMTCTITLGKPVTTATTVLVNSDDDRLIVPASVTFAAGTSSKTFSVSASGTISDSRVASVLARFNNYQRERTITLTP